MGRETRGGMGVWARVSHRSFVRSDPARDRLPRRNRHPAWGGRWRPVERRERRGSGGHLGAAGTLRDFLCLEWEDERNAGGRARAHRDVSRGSDSVSVYLVRRVVVVVVVERAAGVRPVPDARGPARGSGDRRSAVSEAAHGLGWGLQGRRRGHGDTEEARGDSLGAPRPPVMADLASPHGTLVGGHRRAACPDGTPRDVREAALSAPSFVQSPERRFHALAIITCYPYRDAVEINNQTR